VDSRKNALYVISKSDKAAMLGPSREAHQMPDGRITFRRYGRCRHLHIATAEDLAFALELDEAHWAAVNAPNSTINCDPTFLDLVDTDRNARVICRELRDAIRWTLEVLKDHSGLESACDVVQLNAINTDCDEGRCIHDAGVRMLASLGDGDADRITLGQVRQIKTQVESTPVSESAVVLPEASDDPEIRQFISDVIATTGGAAHPSGHSGLGPTQLDAFIADAEAWCQWHGRATDPACEADSEIMPLGDDTAAVYEVFAAVRGKLDQYFAQCQAAALDERFVQRMGWTEAELAELDFDDPATLRHVLAKAPLARARSDAALHFDDQINPCYQQSIERFRSEVASRMLDGCETGISGAQWETLKGMFAAHQEWLDAMPQTQIEPLGPEKLGAYLDAKYADAVRGLMAHGAETAFGLGNIRLTEKLVLFQAHLLDLANNFVSFPHLYDPERRAMFETGTLVIDGRRFNLAVRVDDRKEHVKIAETSNMFVLYVEVTPGPAGGEKYEVAVPVTAGGKGNLCVGKRGLFVDVHNNQCDARVVGIIENPISLREAFVAPFVRMGRLLTGKIESLTARAEEKLDTSTSEAVGRIASGGDSQNAPRPASGASTGGMLMGAGVALAALGSALAYITKTLADTSWVAIVIGVLAALLVVLLPTSIVAVLKLRKRDLSAILEGSGWGVNARMRLTSKMARFFSAKPPYPKKLNSHRKRNTR